MSAVVEIKNIKKTYHIGDIEVNALSGVSLQVEQGEMVAIAGPSGSGKSTLMNIIGCLDWPTSGEYILDHVDVSKMSDDEQALIRNKKIGFVFQQFNLLPRPRQRAFQIVRAIRRAIGIKQECKARARLGLPRARLYTAPNEARTMRVFVA